MRRYILCFVLLTGHGAASASADDGCDELGLKSSYLTAYFCNALEDIAKTPGQGRQLGTDRGEPVEEVPGVVDRAYRADPRKTLALIKRIKSAGGLAEE